MYQNRERELLAAPRGQNKRKGELLQKPIPETNPPEPTKRELRKHGHVNNPNGIGSRKRRRTRNAVYSQNYDE